MECNDNIVNIDTTDTKTTKEDITVTENPKISVSKSYVITNRPTLKSSDPYRNSISFGIQNKRDVGSSSFYSSGDVSVSSFSSGKLGAFSRFFLWSMS